MFRILILYGNFYCSGYAHFYIFPSFLRNTGFKIIIAFIPNFTNLIQRFKALSDGQTKTPNGQSQNEPRFAQPLICELISKTPN